MAYFNGNFVVSLTGLCGWPVACGKQRNWSDLSATQFMPGVSLVRWQYSLSWWTLMISLTSSSNPISGIGRAGSVRIFPTLKIFHFSLTDRLIIYHFFSSIIENVSAGHLMFFLMPVGIQISVNVVLFVITAIYCNRVKSEIHRMQMIDNCEQKKKRYIADKAMWVMLCWMAWKAIEEWKSIMRIYCESYQGAFKKLFMAAWSGKHSNLCFLFHPNQIFNEP